MTETNACAECGAALRSDAVFCIACGHTVRGIGGGQYAPGAESVSEPPPVPMPPPPTPSAAPPDWSRPPGTSGTPGYSPTPYVAPVKTYLVESILATLLCCLPIGIAGIVFAAQAESHSKSGNYAAAVEASNKAKLWTTLSFVFGIISGLFWIALVFVGITAG